MQKLHLLFLAFILIFISCQKETLSDLPDEKMAVVPTTDFIMDSCPELEDVLCHPGGAPNVEALFGDLTSGNPSTWGLLDRVLNCPNVAIDSECVQACSPVTLTLGYNINDVPWIRTWNSSNSPCNEENVFPIAEQQSIIDDAIALALEHAPICQETNGPMVPIRYDLFWDAIVDYYVGVRVTYITPCFYSAF